MHILVLDQKQSMSSKPVDNTDQRGGGGDMTSTNKVNTSCEQKMSIILPTVSYKVALLGGISVCASCGKEGNSDNMNTCNKCKMVKYCNAACKKKHRSKHKKACERRVAELHAELHDEQLFKEPPPREECPLCFLPNPLDEGQTQFQACCGKIICHGCIYAMMMSEGNDLCAFCRTPPPRSDEEQNKRVKKLIDNNHPYAFNFLAFAYDNGINGMRQDYQKANELWLKAGELGCASAYYNLGISYDKGDGVEIDNEKAAHYYELSAMGGFVSARHNLGATEEENGNKDRAYNHLVIAARAGYKLSLDSVKTGFIDGFVTKEEYASTLRAYHERQKEMRSDTRDKAAAHIQPLRIDT